jgi:EAL domain-containing protein (putative c-di-GMP-specific phosphodiesterase class I)
MRRWHSRVARRLHGATADQCYDASDTEPTARRRGERKRSERVAETNLDDIRRALQANEFFLLYQPVVALTGRRCVGAEALIRWRRGDETVIGAGDFIPQTENTPLSGAITYWVMDTVASELGEWLGSNPDAFIGINVPPEILGRGGIEYVAAKSGLRARAKQLVLEITERGVPDQLGLSALNGIPATGVRVALDDTTLSGANLALLTRCHFDFVKLGQTLVAQLGADLHRPEWLDGLAALLGTTGLQIIAEGVERAQQATMLEQAGVQFAQGHLFSGPLPALGLKRYYARD